MDKVNPDNNLLLNLKERLQGFFATKDYVKALVERAKSDLVRWFFFVLIAIMGFVWYLHNDTKQALKEAKQERQEIKQQMQADKSELQQQMQAIKSELQQQISELKVELKALIESLHGVNKGKPTSVQAVGS